jgi:beta-N-acetylhexosaminidase
MLLSASLAIALMVVVVSPGANSGQHAGTPVQTRTQDNPRSSSEEQQAEELANAGNLRDELGQNFVVGIPGPTFDDKTEHFLSHVRPGGIVLYYRNVKSREQLRTLISDLQSFALKTTGHPYFIMIDEEPGAVTRLGLFEKVRASAKLDWDAVERDISVLESEGINVELAPLADFSFNQQSFLRKRIPADSIPELLRFNRRFIVLLHKHRISATLKHFPGMGIFEVDSHKQLPVGNIDAPKLESSLNIFKDGIKSGAGLVMTGHALYGNLDPDNPATLSPKIIGGMLRQKLAFRGLVITDDLSQMALARSDKMTIEDATIAAAKAGNNLLMFSHNFPKTEQVFDVVLQRAEQDQRFRQAVEQSSKSIIDFKRKTLNAPPVPQLARVAASEPASIK